MGTKDIFNDLPEGVVPTIREIFGENPRRSSDEIAAAFRRREPEMARAIGGDRELVAVVELVKEWQ